MNRLVPSNFMSDIEYSVIMSDVIKSFDCIVDTKKKRLNEMVLLSTQKHMLKMNGIS